MAILKLGPLAASITGTLGGVTFRHHRSRTVLSAFNPGTRSRTLFQQRKTSSLSQLSYRWRSVLTQTQRRGWTYFGSNPALSARSKNSGPFPGRTAYLQFNLMRATASLAPQDTAPAIPSIARTPAWTFGGAAHLYVVYNINIDPLIAGEHALVSFMSPTTAAALHKRTWSTGYATVAGPLAVPYAFYFPRPFNPGCIITLHARRLSNVARYSNPMVTVFTAI